MIDRTMEVIKEKEELKLTDITKNIAPITKTEKKEIIEKQTSRFRAKWAMVCINVSFLI